MDAEGTEGPPVEGGEQPIVPFIRLRCATCRRARGAYLARVARGMAGIPARGGHVPLCPHHRTLWAPGEGPDAEPSADTAPHPEAHRPDLRPDLHRPDAHPEVHRPDLHRPDAAPRRDAPPRPDQPRPQPRRRGPV
ncbi:hypothetical protein [Frankia sp. AiPa1]|uniref:hypothetical protein n=1 Tax=Frankia sp. AiPa1 TaxID=573492 RepID=UPI00202AD85A|nr:hypothetical protein [Frankia sp. AiPa1]MCL9762269.1 hypothetical protein [Frankia sp. AiPa1]